MDSKLLMLLGGGALLYWYLTKQQTPATTTTTTTTGTGTGTSTTGTTPGAGATNTTPVPNQFPTTLSRIQAALVAGGVTNYGGMLQSPDAWNTYANSAIPGFTAPAPEDLFPNATDAHAPVTFSAWWSALQKFLPAGLSGYGPVSPHWHMAGGWRA